MQIIFETLRTSEIGKKKSVDTLNDSKNSLMIQVVVHASCSQCQLSVYIHAILSNLNSFTSEYGHHKIIKQEVIFSIRVSNDELGDTLILIRNSLF